MPSDLEQLLDMGFEKERAEIAVKKTGGCTSSHLTSHTLPFLLDPTHWRLTAFLSTVQGALEWLEKHQDKSLEDIQATEASNAEDESEEATQAKIAELETGLAKSMVCNECGKKFRSLNAAEFHASKT